MDARLQEAVEAVECYLADTGLRCSPEKSELLLYRPRKLGRPPKGTSDFQIKGINHPDHQEWDDVPDRATYTDPRALARGQRLQTMRRWRA
ncbi:hypothetical protein MTO96_034955 [Rhipicephalus appendiculatus]